MKKLITLSLLLVSIVSLSIAQNISIDTTYFNRTGTTNDFSLEGLSYVSNTTGAAQTLRWQRVVVSAPSAWTCTNCDMNSCYGPTTDHMDFTMPAGATNGLIRLDMMPNGVAGTGTYQVFVYSTTDSSHINGIITYDFTVTQANSVSTVAYFQGVGLYPNPAKNFLKVSLSPNQSASKVEVYNLLGDKVATQSFQSGNNEFSVNLNGLMNGTYFLHVIMSDGTVVTRKFSKN